MLSAFKCSQLSTPFTEKALAFKDRVYKANTCPGKAKWNADEILGAVENIPGLVRGVAKEAGAQNCTTRPSGRVKNSPRLRQST